MTTIIQNIAYNPSASAFEGRVDVKRGNRTFRYPCTVPGPLTMPMGDVRKQMKQTAQRMSDTNPTLFSQR